MIVDIDKYRLNRDFVRAAYLERRSDDLGMLISVLACSTMCPCVVIAYWIGEDSNWHPETVLAIKRLTKFYGYTKILNKPAGAPV